MNFLVEMLIVFVTCGCIGVIVGYYGAKFNLPQWVALSLAAISGIAFSLIFSWLMVAGK